MPTYVDLGVATNWINLRQFASKESFWFAAFVFLILLKYTRFQHAKLPYANGNKQITCITLYRRIRFTHSQKFGMVRQKYPENDT